MTSYFAFTAFTAEAPSDTNPPLFVCSDLYAQATDAFDEFRHGVQALAALGTWPAAQVFLGRQARDNAADGKTDPEEAVAWFHKGVYFLLSSSLRLSPFCTLSARIFLIHSGFDLFLSVKAAKLGDADGQAELALCWAEGLGVPLDMAQAEAWYKKAADQGCDKGNHYGHPQGGGLTGFLEAKRKQRADGRIQSLNVWGVGYPIAHAWHLRAAEAGFAPSQCTLGGAVQPDPSLKAPPGFKL